ncbi:MAG: hypothetical protein A2Y95_10390 [Deltaproteobacteria bacterium RBG_13_65_10]|jgi:hypothetical protein|nr:MAG: hypothetical protein A2Y95_10390 [Deltaproteobacteria bacterium RBG_13_65_10]
MRDRNLSRAILAPALLVLAGISWLLPVPPAGAEVFKWTDENSVVHYTANRASIPIKFQDTVKIVETPPEMPLARTREFPASETGIPGLEEEELPADSSRGAPPSRTDVTGNVLVSGQGAAAKSARTKTEGREASIPRSAALPMQGYLGRGEGWWRAQFLESLRGVERQQQIVESYRDRLRQIIKSHSGGDAVLPLEDDPEFQKMANILPREESRLNQLKRNMRRLQARANELRIPSDWRE